MKKLLFSVSFLFFSGQLQASHLQPGIKLHQKPTPEYTTILLNQLLAQPSITDKKSLQFIKGHIKSQDKKIKSQALKIKDLNKKIAFKDANFDFLHKQYNNNLKNQKESLGYSALKFSAQYIATTAVLVLLIAQAFKQSPNNSFDAWGKVTTIDV